MFGGGSSSAFGSRSGNILTKATAILAAYSLLGVIRPAFAMTAPWITDRPNMIGVIQVPSVAVGGITATATLGTAIEALTLIVLADEQAFREAYGVELRDRYFRDGAEDLRRAASEVVVGTAASSSPAVMNWSQAIWAVASCMATRSGRVAV